MRLTFYILDKQNFLASFYFHTSPIRRLSTSTSLWRLRVTGTEVTISSPSTPSSSGSRHTLTTAPPSLALQGQLLLSALVPICLNARQSHKLLHTWTRQSLSRRLRTSMHKQFKERPPPCRVTSSTPSHKLLGKPRNSILHLGRLLCQVARLAVLQATLQFLLGLECFHRRRLLHRLPRLVSHSSHSPWCLRHLQACHLRVDQAHEVATSGRILPSKTGNYPTLIRGELVRMSHQLANQERLRTQLQVPPLQCQSVHSKRERRPIFAAIRPHFLMSGHRTRNITHLPANLPLFVLLIRLLTFFLFRSFSFMAH